MSLTKQSDKSLILEKKQKYMSLKKGHSLVVSEKENTDLVSIKNKNGDTLFSIEISEQGTELQLASENISIKASNSLTFAAKKITIESSKETFIKSDGNLQQYTKGNRTIETQGENIETAKTQYIKAFLGDVKLKANDDIKLNGERVKLNCD